MLPLVTATGHQHWAAERAAALCSHTVLQQLPLLLSPLHFRQDKTRVACLESPNKQGKMQALSLSPYHFSHGSEPGICRTAVLLSGCTGSAREGKETISPAGILEKPSHRPFLCGQSWLYPHPPPPIIPHCPGPTLLAPNCTRAFPFTSVALICMITDSME